jgi:hypothetical protein
MTVVCGHFLFAVRKLIYIREVVFKDVMIPMRNGVKLACNIYRPARNGKLVEGKFPVILERTPYSKDAGEWRRTAASRSAMSSFARMCGADSIRKAGGDSFVMTLTMATTPRDGSADSPVYATSDTARFGLRHNGPSNCAG